MWVVPLSEWPKESSLDVYLNLSMEVESMKNRYSKEC
jgi:hypothetical protein